MARSVRGYEASFVQAMAAVPFNQVTEIREDPDNPGSYTVFLDPRVDSDDYDPEEFVSAEKAYNDWLAAPGERYFRTNDPKDLQYLEYFEDITSDMEVRFVDDDSLYPSVLEGLERPQFTAGRIVYKRTQEPDQRNCGSSDPSDYPDFAKLLANRIPVQRSGNHPDPSNTVETQFHPGITIATQAGRGNDRDWLLLVEELLLRGRNVGLQIGWEGLGKSLSELAPRIPVDENQVVFCKHCNEPMTLGKVQWAQFLREREETWFFCSHEHQARYRYSRSTPEELAQLIATDVVRYVRQYRFYGCRVDDLQEDEIEQVLADWCANESFRGPLRARVYSALDKLGYSGRGDGYNKIHFDPSVYGRFGRKF